MRTYFRIGIRLVPCVLGLAACKNFPSQNSAQCGNAVIEASEDCDSFPRGEGTYCVPAGQPNECHLACKVLANGQVPNCPQGWGCGLDGMCREPASQFSTAESVIAGAHSVRMGDFDGDGRKDVLALGPLESLGKARATVYYFDDQAALQNTYPISIPLISPVITNYWSSGMDSSDEIVFGRRGIASLHGESGRKLVYGPGVVENYDTEYTKVVPFEILGQIGSKSVAIASVAILQSSPQGTVLYHRDSAQKVLLGNPELFSSLAGNAATGKLDEFGGSSCNSFVLAFRGENHVNVLNPCTLSDEGINWNSNLGLVRVTTSEPIDSGVQLADLDGDYRLDLLVAVKTKEGATRIRVAYGNGKGDFFSTPEIMANFPDNPDNSLGSEYWSLMDAQQGSSVTVSALPLAVGSFNRDVALDFIFPTFVYLSKVTYDDDYHATVTYSKYWERTRGSWSSADFFEPKTRWAVNSSNVFVASSADELDIDLFQSTQEQLTRYSLPTEGFVSKMLVLDANNDFFPDILYSQTSTTGGFDSINIIYGRVTGFPSASVKVAEVDSVIDLFRLRYPDPAGVLYRSSTEGKPASSFWLSATFDDQLFPQSVLRSTANKTTALSPGNTITPEGSTPLLITVGPLVGSPIDTFCLAYYYPGYGIRDSSMPMQSWIALGEGGRTGKFSEIVDGKISFETNETPLLIANADIDNDQTAEILIASKTSNSSESYGRIQIGHISKGENDFKWTSKGEIKLTEPLLAPSITGQLMAIDLNEDEYQDLVYSSGNGSLTIFWNDGNGSFVEKTTIEKEGVKAFAPIHGAENEISSLVFTLSSSVIHAKPNHDRVFQLETIASGFTFLTGIGAGDINGDGLEDLAVVDNQKLIILRGEAVKR